VQLVTEEERESMFNAAACLLVIYFLQSCRSTRLVDESDRRAHLQSSANHPCGVMTVSNDFILFSRICARQDPCTALYSADYDLQKEQLHEANK
jgi:hypothetical protein